MPREDPPLEFGPRIALAREDADMTQAALGAAVGLDRTAVVKMESGARKVAASELVRIAGALDRPIDWFVSESPPAVVSRRRAAAEHATARLDMRVERIARDIAFLRDNGCLPGVDTRPEAERLTDLASAEALARKARRLLDMPYGPVLEVQRVVERLGLLAFCFDLGEIGGDAAYVEVNDLGVAVVNGAADPGRRRFSLVHELGHHLSGDAFDRDGFGSSQDTERLINAFAVHFLLPRADVATRWNERDRDDPRAAAIGISYGFRTSWTVTCNQLRNLDLVSEAERARLSAARPTPADAVALGEHWVSEMDVPAIPPEYGKRVLAAYVAGKLTASRTEELLWGTVQRTDLPEQRPLPLEALRWDFEPLS